MRYLQAFALCLFVGCSLLLVEGVPLESQPEPEERGFIICNACNRMVKQMFTYFDQGVTNEQIIDTIASICTTFRLFDSSICRGFLDASLPTIRYIYENTDIITGNVCGLILSSENCSLSDPEKLEWSIKPSDIPKPSLTEPPPAPLGSPTLKVLHLSDLHWDPEYLEGSNANCHEPLCCRASSGNLTNPKDAAGYWGDYGSCDIPWRTIENTVMHMSKQHPDTDYILWTGDLIPHDVWSTTKHENIYIIDSLVNLLAKYFPGVTVYPTLGNHEAHPVNSFAPPEVTDEEHSISWLYEEADRQWANWLPAEVSSTIRYGGYYTTIVKPGLRMVSMNMNYCYTFNWWTLAKSEDPASGLLWLTKVLEEAEMNGEKVHIISHIAPGGPDCMSVFSREYNKIVNRFESTITAQFFGHTHTDEFKIFYDAEDPTRPTNVAFIGPSVTTYLHLNPGYKVYTIDGERSGSTFAVLDHSTWYMNLTAANLAAKSATNKLELDPEWEELYQARAEYGIADLSPKQLDDFLNRLVSDNALSQLYFKNYNKASDFELAAGCDTSCLSDMLCSIVTTNYWDQSRCRKIKENFSYIDFV